MRNEPLNSNPPLYHCSTKLPLSSLDLDISSKAKKHHKKLGFTIIELMVTIAVAAIVITIAIPSMSDFIVKMRVDNEISQLNRLVLTARNTAISTEQTVTFCPLGENNVCTNNWDNELSVFIDLNGNGTYEPPATIPAIPAPPALPIPYERILKVKSSTTAGDSITYLGQSRITFSPTGILASGASTFLYCPSSDKALARALVLSISGRTVLSADSDGDGIDEFRTGADVTCP